MSIVPKGGVVLRFPSNSVQMQGQGTYQYKKSGDIYSGKWVNNQKHGDGQYEFKADSSIFEGQWENGQIVTGKWILQGAAVFEGQFKLGRPFGEGKFTFESGLTQKGAWVIKKAGEGEEEEAPAEGEAPRPPNVTWKGESIVSF